MVKHIVLWKIKDDDDKQKNIDRMIEMLTSLVGKIDGLVSVEMGYNFNTNSDYDVVLYATLKNPVALKYYQNHPEHVKCKDFIGQISVGRTAADYFYEEETVSARPFDEVPDAPDNPETNSPFVTSANNTPFAENPFTEPQKEETPFVFNREIDIEVNTAVSAEPVSSPIKDNSSSFFNRQADFEPAQTFTPEPIPEPVPEPIPEPIPESVSNSVPSETIFKPIASDPVPEAPKPFSAPAPSKQVSTQTNPVSTENQTIKETTSIFGKKKIDVDVTPLEQRSDTWTCPNCGKIMPNYVGTCGCGEMKPFDFAPPIPTDSGSVQNTEPAPKKSNPFKNPAPKPAPAPAKQVSTQTNPVSTENQTIKETTSIFGKKKIDVDVTPLEQRSDTWTCPNCGKIMPNYVGTCGCGEMKPFDFAPTIPSDSGTAQKTEPAPKKSNPFKNPAPKSAPRPTKQVSTQTNPVSTENQTIKETTSIFGKKKIDVEVTPLEQRSDTWTCPNCGKVMPNYVGTCGCGEMKPFDFGEPDDTDTPQTSFDQSPAPESSKFDEKPSFFNERSEEPLPNISSPKKSAQRMSQEDMQDFSNVEPSLESYNPQIQTNNPEPQNDFSFIRNDDFSEAKPMTFNDTPPAPMRFSDEAPSSMNFGNDNTAPMRFNDVEPSSQPAPQPVKSTKPEKRERKHFFGKKAKEEEVFRQAQEAVNNRKDVPNSGTWTCPNCGKVMPKYVGTCGCGEQQPFDF